MKKAKIMLTSIAVLAVVGGALAFKANKAFKDTFCTRIDSGVCTSSLVSVSDPGGNEVYFYTPTNDINACGAGNVDCLSSTTFIQD